MRRIRPTRVGGARCSRSGDRYFRKGGRLPIGFCGERLQSVELLEKRLR